MPHQVEFPPRLHLIRLAPTEISLTVDPPQVVRVLQEMLQASADDLFIYLLKAYSPINRTQSPQGFSQAQISHKLNTTRTLKTNAKHIYT